MTFRATLPPGDNPGMRFAMRCLLLAGLVAASSCGLPERNNEFDPVNAPRVSLVVPTTDGSRTTTFVFDATGSTDPRNRGPLAFAWDLDGTEPPDFELVTGTNGLLQTRLPLDPSDLAGAETPGVGAVGRRVAVRVRTADGASAFAHAIVVIRNAAPSADAGEDLFVSPRTDLSIVLDACGGGLVCTSTDPDGDELTFRWTQLGAGAADPAELTPLDERWQRVRLQAADLPTTRPLLFEVEADDGLASNRDVLHVFREAQVWATTFSPNHVYRVFPGFRQHRSVTQGGVETAWPVLRNLAFDATTDSIWFSHSVTGGAVFERADRALAILGSWSISGYMNARWLAPAGDGGACVIATDSTEQGVFARITGGGSLVSTPSSAPRRSFPLPTDDGCWTVAAQAVGRLGDDGTWTMVEDGFVNVVSAAVGADGTLWIADRSDDDVLPRTAVIGVGAGGIIARFELDGWFLDAIEPHRSGLWVHDALTRELAVLGPDGALRRTDAPRTRLSISASNPRQMVSDVPDDALWISDSGSGELIRLFDTGGEAVVTGRVAVETIDPQAFRWAPLAVDPVTGKAWGFASGFERRIAEVPPHGRRFERLPVITGFPWAVAPDPIRGAAWIADPAITEGAVLRTSDRGREIVRNDVRSFAASVEDDGSVWVGTRSIATSGRVLHYGPEGEEIVTSDMGGYTVRALDGGRTAGPLCGVAVDENGTGASAGGFRVDRTSGAVTFLSPEMSDPASAAVTPGGACWIVDRYDQCSAPDSLLRYDPGSTTPALVISSAFGVALGCSWDLVADPRDGGVWVADAANARTVRFDPAGVADVAHSVIGRTMAVMPCDGADCLELWVGTDSSLQRIDAASGQLLESFEVPALFFVDVATVP